MATKKKAVKKKVVKKKVVKKITRKKSAPSKFYEFRQNNSFGKFDYDIERGISVSVIVEADIPADANGRARDIGLYFNGAGDCPCCGNRWYEKYTYSDTTDDSTKFPSVYGEEVKPGTLYPKKNGKTLGKWTQDGEFEGFIHYKNGKVAGFWN